MSVPPSLPRGGNKPRIPHIFTEDELANFFNATILLRKPVNISDFDFKLRSMQIPVFFRLLLSTGMRTNEARLLAVSYTHLSKDYWGLPFLNMSDFQY